MGWKLLLKLCFSEGVGDDFAWAHWTAKAANFSQTVIILIEMTAVGITCAGLDTCGRTWCCS